MHPNPSKNVDSEVTPAECGPGASHPVLKAAGHFFCWYCGTELSTKKMRPVTQRIFNLYTAANEVLNSLTKHRRTAKVAEFILNHAEELDILSTAIKDVEEK